MQLPFAFVSASEGTNVVKVFTEAVRIGKVAEMLCRRARAALDAAADVPRKSGEGLFR